MKVAHTLNHDNDNDIWNMIMITIRTHDNDTYIMINDISIH